MSSRIIAIKEMLEAEPNDAFLIYALALEYEKSNYIHQAVDALENLKTNQPEYLPTFYKLGKLYELLLNNIAALAVYKQGVLLARKTNEVKTLAELNEAIQNLED
jgi:predicted Zn-dependent protease